MVRITQKVYCLPPASSALSSTLTVPLYLFAALSLIEWLALYVCNTTLCGCVCVKGHFDCVQLRQYEQATRNGYGHVFMKTLVFKSNGTNSSAVARSRGNVMFHSVFKITKLVKCGVHTCNPSTLEAEADRLGV